MSCTMGSEEKRVKEEENMVDNNGRCGEERVDAESPKDQENMVDNNGGCGGERVGAEIPKDQEVMVDNHGASKVTEEEGANIGDSITDRVKVLKRARPRKNYNESEDLESTESDYNGVRAGKKKGVSKRGRKKKEESHVIIKGNSAGAKRKTVGRRKKEEGPEASEEYIVSSSVQTAKPQKEDVSGGEKEEGKGLEEENKEADKVENKGVGSRVRKSSSIQAKAKSNIEDEANDSSRKGKRKGREKNDDELKSEGSEGEAKISQQEDEKTNQRKMRSRRASSPGAKKVKPEDVPKPRLRKDANVSRT